MRAASGTQRFTRNRGTRSYAVYFTPAEFARLQQTGDLAQCVRLAVGTFPEEEPVTEEYLSSRATFDLPLFLVAKVERLARANNASYSAVVRAAVRRYLETEGP